MTPSYPPPWAPFSRRSCSSEFAPSRTWTTRCGRQAYSALLADDAPSTASSRQRTTPGPDALLLVVARRRRLQSRSRRASRPSAAERATGRDHHRGRHLFEAARHVPFGLGSPRRRAAAGARALPARGDPRRAGLSLRTPNSFREGVWYSAERNVDAFFVTLKKSEADYSPTTMYRDYPISPTLFHWESQSTTSVLPNRSALPHRSEHRSALRPARARG